MYITVSASNIVRISTDRKAFRTDRINPVLFRIFPLLLITCRNRYDILRGIRSHNVFFSACAGNTDAGMTGRTERGNGDRGQRGIGQKRRNLTAEHIVVLQADSFCDQRGGLVATVL